MADKIVSVQSVIASLRIKAWASALNFQSVPLVNPFRSTSSSFEGVKNAALVSKDKINKSCTAIFFKVRSMASQGQLERFDAVQSFAAAKKRSMYEALVTFKSRAQSVAQGKPIISGMTYNTSFKQTVEDATDSSLWAKVAGFGKSSAGHVNNSFVQNNTQAQYKWYSLFGPKFYTGISEATLKAQKSASFWKGSFFGSVTTATAIAWMNRDSKQQKQSTE